MGETSKIEWCDSTFNGWIGCQHISPGCDHCYAEAQNAFRKWAADGQWGPHADRKRTSAATWSKPREWNANAKAFTSLHHRRRRVFSASLSDWLDNQVPREWRSDLCRLIEDTRDLDWLLLTKRPQNYRKLAPATWQSAPPPNVWLGFTAEDEHHYRMRWPLFARMPATVRFVSYEPAVGDIGAIDFLSAGVPDWIIFGGESGSQARTAEAGWARSVRDQCQRLGIAYFHKQWGSYASNPVSAGLDPPSNGKGGGLLDGKLWRQFPC